MSNSETGRRKKGKTVFEVYEKRRQHSEERNKTRVFLGDTFKRWRALKAQNGLQTDAQVAKFLLDSYEEKTESCSAKKPEVASNTSPPPSPPHDETPQVPTSSTPPDPQLDKCPSCGFALPPCNLKNQNAPNKENQPEIIEVTLELESEESGENKQSKGGEDSEDWDFMQYYTLTEINKATKADATEDSAETESNGKRKLCTECGALYTKKRHECEHKTKPFVCNSCGKRCVSETALKIHHGIHSDTHELACKYCLVSFKTKVDKLAHEAVHQEQQDPFKCPDCTQTFPSYRKRSEHLNNHWDKNRFKCAVCGVRFKNTQRLLRHIVVHTGLKAFRCSVCGRRFNQEGHLKSHMRLHTGERPFRCQHCDAAFTYNLGLKSHVLRFHPTVQLDKEMEKEDMAAM